MAEYDDFEGIAWRWQSMDGAMFKAALAQEAVEPNPTDRGKKWERTPVYGAVSGPRAIKLHGLLGQCLFLRVLVDDRALDFADHVHLAWFAVKAQGELFFAVDQL